MMEILNYVLIVGCVLCVYAGAFLAIVSLIGVIKEYKRKK